MARPQSPDYDRRREAILAAAAGLYARRGFKGASVADLAKSCGTSKALIYHYFPSKDDILYEVMASHLDDLVDASEEALQNGDPRQRLGTLSLSFMQLYADAQEHQKVLLNELDNLPSERRSDVVRKQRRIISTVEALVREIRPEVETSALPITMLFFGMINWTHTWFKRDGDMAPEQLAELATSLVLDGLNRLQAS